MLISQLIYSKTTQRKPTYYMFQHDSLYNHKTNTRRIRRINVLEKMSNINS